MTLKRRKRKRKLKKIKYANKVMFKSKGEKKKKAGEFLVPN